MGKFEEEIKKSGGVEIDLFVMATASLKEEVLGDLEVPDPEEEESDD